MEREKGRMRDGVKRRKENERRRVMQKGKDVLGSFDGGFREERKGGGKEEEDRMQGERWRMPDGVSEGRFRNGGGCWGKLKLENETT